MNASRAVTAALLAASLLSSNGIGIAAERALEKTVLVNAGIDPVWDAWTTKAGITALFAPDAEIDPRVGGAFHVYFNPYAPAGSKGADTMRYAAIQPKTMLSFDWNAPPSLPAVREQRTFVVVRLRPEGGQTRVTLRHSGWADADGADGAQWDAAFTYFDRAWDSVLANLHKRFAAGGGPTDWGPFLEQMRKITPPAKD